jgi:hypothetical protein
MSKLEILGRQEIFDTFGAPEYFYTHIGAIEDAGGGMLRIIRCIVRGGLLIPVCSTVAPASSVIQHGKDAREFGFKMLQDHAAAHH